VLQFAQRGSDTSGGALPCSAIYTKMVGRIRSAVSTASGMASAPAVSVVQRSFVTAARQRTAGWSVSLLRPG